MRGESRARRSDWRSGRDRSCCSASRDAASAQVPAGGEFRVNTYTTGAQGSSGRPAMEPDGDFVVVWTSIGQDGSSFGSSASGSRPRGPGGAASSRSTPTPPASSTTPPCGRPARRLRRGVDELDAGRHRLRASGRRRYDRGGRRHRARVPGQHAPRPATQSEPAGGRRPPMGDSWWPGRARIQTAPSARSPPGDSTRSANAHRQRVRGEHVHHRAAAGARTLTVEDERQLRRRLDGLRRHRLERRCSASATTASGNRLGGEFQVNTYTIGARTGRRSAGLPAAASSSPGSAPDGDQRRNVRPALRCRPATRWGTEFAVNTFTTGYQYARRPRGARRGRATSSSSWASEPAAGTAPSIFAQRFAAHGSAARRRVPRQHLHHGVPERTRRSPPTRVGNFVVAWSSDGRTAMTERLRAALRRPGARGARRRRRRQPECSSPARRWTCGPPGGTSTAPRRPSAAP